MADLRTLDRRLHPWARWLYQTGKQYDGRLVVTSAYRSMAKQQRLWDRWQSGQSSIPAARPGRSLHQYRLAFDLARIGIDPHGDELLAWLGALWESVGGRYGGTRDPVHFDVKT